MSPLAIVLSAFSLANAQPRLVIDSGGHQATIKSVIFTKDGRRLISAGDDKTVRVWDLSTGKTVSVIRRAIGDGPEGMIYAMALSPDERLLAVGGYSAGSLEERHTIWLHDLESEEIVGRLEGHADVVVALAFSPNGRSIALGGADKTIRVWDVRARTQTWQRSDHSDFVYGIAFSPDGKRVASGSWDKSVRVWDRETGKPIGVPGAHSDRVRRVAWSPDGKYLVSGSDDGEIRVWDGNTGNVVKTLARIAHVGALAFSPDGRRLVAAAGGGDFLARAFSFPEGRALGSLQLDNGAFAAAVSPDGRLAAVAGGDTHAIVLWEMETGKVVQRLQGAGRPVWSVAAGAKGRGYAFGQTYEHQNDNRRGPLERSIGMGEFRVSSERPAESGFVRGTAIQANQRLETKAGSAGRWSVLRVMQGDVEKVTFEREPFSGYDHRSYTFLPNGGKIASGGNHGDLRLYSLTQGSEHRELRGHTAVVWAVAAAPDGKTLISGAHDQTVRLWDLPSGNPLLTLFYGTDGEWVAWTPQGYYTASANGEKYIGWHVNQGVDKQALYYPASRFQKQFYRPDIVDAFLELRDITKAEAFANARRGGEFRGQPPATPAVIIEMQPPDVTILQPPDLETRTQQRRMRLIAEARSRKHPVMQMEVLLDGNPLRVPLEAIQGAGDRKRLQIEVQLREGSNELTVIARHEHTASEPETRRIHYEPTAEERTRRLAPRLIVLAVGVSAYEAKSLKLDFADDDARGFLAAAVRQKGPMYREVITKQVIDPDASKKGILDGLNWLRDTGDENDFRGLFLSGHAGPDEQGNYYFWTRQHQPGGDPEIDDIRWDTIIQRLTSRGRAILFVDTCHAQAVTGKTRGGVDFTQVLKEMKSRYRGLVTFASSSGMELSREDAKWGHGAFTKVLLDVMGGAGVAEGPLHTDKLGLLLREGVQKLTEGQTPSATHSEGLPPFPLFLVGGGR